MGKQCPGYETSNKWQYVCGFHFSYVQTVIFRRNQVITMAADGQLPKHYTKYITKS